MDHDRATLGEADAGIRRNTPVTSPSSWDQRGHVPGPAVHDDRVAARLSRYATLPLPGSAARECELPQQGRKALGRLVFTQLLGLALLAGVTLGGILLLSNPLAIATPGVGFAVLAVLTVQRARLVRRRMDDESARASRAWAEREVEVSETVARDDLTDLGNRRFFFARLSEELDAAVRTKQSLAVLMIDVDDLKKINDEFGHPVGDAALREFARTLRRRARLGYLTARLGGDEFAVIMPGAGRREADQMAHALWQDLATSPVVVSATASIYLGVSVGAAGYPWAGQSLEEIVKWADAKMYVNKLERKGVPTSAAKHPDARLVGAVVDGLSAALNVRDQMTHQHSGRVARMSVCVARTMGLPDELVREIQYAAALHDIGKIGVPDRILRKVSSLTDSEWRDMRRHSDLGHQILKGIDFLSTSAEIVRAHHERWDGSGYPQGLKGAEIPIGSRVFGVVDSYDAMTSRRPYRRALPRGEALEEIRGGAGTQFDPKVVEAFFTAIAQNPDGFVNSPDDGELVEASTDAIQDNERRPQEVEPIHHGSHQNAILVPVPDGAVSSGMTELRSFKR